MPKIVWKDENYVTAYELAREGLSDNKIAAGLGVTVVTMVAWKRKRKAFKEAIERGRTLAGGKATTDFFEYVYNHLPENLRTLWDEIIAADKKRNGIERVEALLLNAGKRARQQLFFHALVCSNFNCSEACRKVNISRKTLEHWIAADPDFPALMDEMEWHKKNFFEGQLVGLVARGNPLATIFVNKTHNKDRGYNEKIDVNLSGEVNVNHSYFDVTDLDLPAETLEQILEAMERKEAKE